MAVIVVIAFVVRFSGIDAGFPELLYGDELASTSPAITMLQTGDLYPHLTGNPWFVYGSFYMYVQLVGFIVHFLVGLLLGFARSVGDLEVWRLFWVGRFLNTGFGTLSVILIFLIGRKAYNSRTGMIAAVLLTFSPLAVVYSQYTKPDTFMVFLLSVALYLSLQILEQGQRRAYVMAGLCAGLAIATKFHALGICAPLFAACLLRGIAERRSLLSIGGDGRIYLCFLCVGLGFFVGTPFALLDFPTFITHNAWTFLNPNTFFLAQFGRTPNYSPASFVALLAGTIGGRLTLNSTATYSTYLALAGLLYALLRHKKQDLIIISFLVVTFRLILPGVSTGWRHYWLVMIPFLLLLGARLLVDAVKVVEMKGAFLRRLGNPILAGLTLFLIWAPASIVLRHTLLYVTGYATEWTLARDWVEHNVPAGAQLVVEMEDLAKFPFGMYRIYEILPYGEQDTATAQQALMDYKANGVNYALTYRNSTFAGMEGVTLVADYSALVLDVLFGSPTGHVFLWELSPWPESSGNLYSTAHIAQAREGTINSASFEDPGAVWKDWFVERDGVESPNGVAIAEVADGESTDGRRSLHLRSYAADGDSHLAVAQVIPRPHLDGLEDFRMDFYPSGTEMIGNDNHVSLIVTAESAGGVVLGSHTYHLYDRGVWEGQEQINLLENPGFEDLDQNDAWGIGGLAVIDQKDRHNGTSSLRLGKEDNQSEYHVRQEIKEIKPNTRYYLEMYIKGDRGFVEVRFFDAAGKHLSGLDRILLPDSYSHWRKFAFEMTSQPEAVKAQIWLGVQRAGVIPFDDLFFGEVPASGIDWEVSKLTRLDAWNTFQRNLKKDLVDGGVNWSWVRFVTLRLQVAGGSSGSGAGAYFDNLKATVQPVLITMQPGR